MHSRSLNRKIVDLRIPPMPGRRHVGFSPTGQSWREPSSKRSALVRCSASGMKGELHPAKNHV